MFKKITYYLKLYSPCEILKYSFYELYSRFWLMSVLGSYTVAKEDLIIDRLLGNKKRGFYVDVGAFDPKRFSNTMRFYLRGWKGINIEPDPQNIEKFKKIRRRDINLNIGVDTVARKIFFYRFIPKTVSTFCLKEAKNNIAKKFKLVDKIKVDVLPLTDVFNKYVNKKQIDFLSIDTEGYDLKVLKSNNWIKYRPRIICVESRGNLLIDRYLFSLGYRGKYSNNVNSIYYDEKTG